MVFTIAKGFMVWAAFTACYDNTRVVKECKDNGEGRWIGLRKSPKGKVGAL
jgi:hypothetical protein